MLELVVVSHVERVSNVGTDRALESLHDGPIVSLDVILRRQERASLCRCRWLDSCMPEWWFDWCNVCETRCREVAVWFLYLRKETVVLGPFVGSLTVQCRFFTFLYQCIKLVPGGLVMNSDECLGVDAVER